jgi:hypothetical protein
MPRTRARSTLVILLLLAPLVCGACGLLLTHGPPAGHGNLANFRYTRSVVGPVVDVVLATLSIGFALKDAANEPDYYGNETNKILLVGAARATIWSVSSAIGFDKVRKCVVATRQLAERRAHTPSGGGGATRVYGPNVQRVEITPAADTLLPAERLQLVATAFAPSGGVFLNKLFRWSSSNDAVASISDSGVVTGRAPGTVVIAANADNVIGTASVVVVSAR